MPRQVSFVALEGLPEIAPGTDLAASVRAALRANGVELRSEDLLVVAQKIVSKAEGRLLRLADVVPSTAAIDLAARVQKDPLGSGACGT